MRRDYSTGVDMWALGCIMFELITGRPLAYSSTLLDHAKNLMKIFGTKSFRDAQLLDGSDFEKDLGNCEFPRSEIKVLSSSLLILFFYDQYISLQLKFIKTSILVAKN